MTRTTLSLLLALTTMSCSQANDQAPIQPLSPQGNKPSSGEPDSVKPTWQYVSFADWAQACESLPTNRQLNGRNVSRRDQALSREEFEKALDAALQHFSTGSLAKATSWLGDPVDLTSFTDTSRVYFENKGVPFAPFAQKLQVPSETTLVLHGDFHGDIHSLLALVEQLNEQQRLDGFKIVAPNTRFLFLGDYTDRGAYGVEVVYTLIRLLLANPGKVHLVRGNHEDISLTARYGYFAELRAKFGNGYDLRKPMRIYDFLPVVLYLGTGKNYVQTNHGGMEPGFNPASLLQVASDIAFQPIGVLKQKTYLESHPEFLDGLSPTEKGRYQSMLQDFRPTSPVTPATLGFMWNDFSLLASEPALGYNPGRAWVYGKSATAHILRQASSETHQLRAVIRAHQHSSLLNPMMRRLVACRGVHRHWQSRDSAELLNSDPRQLETILESQSHRTLQDGSVYTLNVAPDSSYGVGCEFDFDSYALLRTASEFGEWTLEVRNIENDKW